jgi:hypothetical protein
MKWLSLSRVGRTPDVAANAMQADARQCNSWEILKRRRMCPTLYETQAARSVFGSSARFCMLVDRTSHMLDTSLKTSDVSKYLKFSH